MAKFYQNCRLDLVFWKWFFVQVFHSSTCSMTDTKWNHELIKVHPHLIRGPGGSMSWSLDLTTHTSLSPIRRGFALGFVNYKKECTRIAAASDKVYQLLVHGRWFSPGTTASSTTKIDFQLQNYLPTCRLLIRPLLKNISGYHYLKINPESIGM